MTPSRSITPMISFPQEISVYFTSQFEEKKPLVSLTWVSPTAKTQIASFSIGRVDTYRVSQDEKLKRKLGGLPPEQALFVDLNSAMLSPVQGHYELQIVGNLFEQDADIDAEMVCLRAGCRLGGHRPPAPRPDDCPAVGACRSRCRSACWPPWAPR